MDLPYPKNQMKKYLKNYLDILKSENKLNIFLLLDTEEKSVNEIYKKSKIKSRTKINNYLNKLEGAGLVKRGIGKRCLTPIGKILQIKLKEFLYLSFAIKKNEHYWNTHLINIPNEFLSYLYVFHDAEVYSNTPSDDTYVLKNIKKALYEDKTKHFYAIVSGYSENYRKIVEELLKNDWNVEVIMSKNLYTNYLTEENKNEIMRMKKCYKNGKLYLSNDVDKFTILFTGENVFLFLFKNDGNVEWNEYLHSKNKEAIILARKIFEFYKEKSTEIK